LLVPVVAAVIAIAVPGAVDRMTEGFSSSTQQLDPTAGGNATANETYTVTAGRNIAWRYVIPKIGEAPWFGWGRLAMKRTGITDFLMNTWQESFPHPHNAYLELLLDNGWVGFMLVIPFYITVLACGFVLLRDQTNPLLAVAGAVCCSLVLALMIASVGSQSFYPVETTVGMWCGIGLMLRMWVERRRAIMDGHPGMIFVEEPVAVAKKKQSVSLFLEEEETSPDIAEMQPEQEEPTEARELWRP
jgi:O-antigen ligase